MQDLELITADKKQDKLQLSSIKVDTVYLHKWNERSNDFVVLTKGEQLISTALYRVGGLGSKPDGNNYFMLLKYVEAYYPPHILKITGSKDPKHLEGRWCIIDKNGIEKVVLDEYKSACIIKDSCIYSSEQNYYNIETGEHYCKSYTSMQSKDFLFLDNAYDSDKLKRGVMKICKKTGTWELFQ